MPSNEEIRDFNRRCARVGRLRSIKRHILSKRESIINRINSENLTPVTLQELEAELLSITSELENIEISISQLQIPNPYNNN